MSTLRARAAQAGVWAGYGVLAACAGMATGHLVAASLTPSSSPVLAVGATVIDRTPTAAKEWAVRELGERDKPVLVGSVLLVTLLAAAVAGLLTRRSRALGVTVLLALVALAGAAAATRPLATARDVLPALATGVIGVAVLLGLARLHTRASGAASDSHQKSTGAGPGSEAPEESPVMPPSEAPPHHPMVAARRRTLVVTAIGVAAASALTGWAGRQLELWRTRIASVHIPEAKDVPAPLPTGLDAAIDGISDFRTANDDFYRVDINLSVPVVPIDEWDLRVDGMVADPFTLTFDELRAMPLVERDITLTCVSNEVGGTYVGSARWRGVLLSTLLERAGVQSGADQVLSTAADGFTISTPLEVVQDGRDALVAIAMNGDPLPAEHGFPARLVTPGIYGFVGATKWLRKLTVTRYEDDVAYWTERDWATDAPIKVSSRIDTPKPLAKVTAGIVPIGGVAWAQQRGIARVEVRIDGGPWRKAQLGPGAGIDYWRQWYLLWDATPGRHSLAVRAITREGEVQTAARTSPFPEGSSGIQEIQVVVE